MDPTKFSDSSREHFSRRQAVMADLTFVIYKMEVTAAHGKPIIVPLSQAA